MKQSELFTKTQKETPKGEESINAKFLTRAGFIHKEMSGVYTYLPLGLRVLNKIENIVREEMEREGGQEILMTVLQPKKLWEETGRWSKEMKEIMYKTEGEGEKKVGLAPTHEEMITNIIKNYVKSWQDLPLAVYQIQTKFRKEARAKSGLLRGREFYMKDLYSFHKTQEDFKKYYQRMKKVYLRVFKRCGLTAIVTEASGAGFTKDFTHEFQVLAKNGEDVIFYCPKEHFSQNKEIAKLKTGQKCPICNSILREGKSIEVGNIFPLGTKYSKSMKASFLDKNGERKPLIMGCYGIGISRIMGAVVEVFHDDKGIIWPKETSPFKAHLIQIENTPKVRKAAEKIYQDFKKEKIEILHDDRKKSAGEKFADADLIGIPWRIVISERTLAKKSAELKKRNEKKSQLVKIEKLKSNVK